MAYHHVLLENERERGAFVSIVHYIKENPVRAGLVAGAKAWPHTGCAVPGYPARDPREEKFWEVFWKIFSKHTSSV